MTRDDMMALFAAGVAAANPERAVAQALHGRTRPTQIIALGKAARAMAQAALAAFPECPALVVTNPENAEPLAGAEVLTGDHPVPSARSVIAGEAVLAKARGLGAGERLLALISGGASALVVAPPDGVSLSQKAALSEAMLGAGLDIVAMNTVRQHLSQTKGGGLAAACAPAIVESLILSDVIGDDPRAIASGPTQAPLGTPAQAKAILEEAGLWDHATAPIRALLERDTKDAHPVVVGRTDIVGSNRLSVAAMLEAARTLGVRAQVLNTPLVGDVSEAAAQVLGLAAREPGLWLAGGETTVRLRGAGRGGRNQELALRVARGFAQIGRRALFLSAGTDGRDGPTDAAGGLVDQTTWGRIKDAEALLENNDSYVALAAAGDLVKIPATGTNVADLQVLWVA